MPNFNKVLLMGHLTRDPEMREIPGGQTVTSLGIALNRTYMVGEDKREEVTFVEVEAWGKRGETVYRHFRKSSPIFIEGRLKLDTWESKEGEKRSKLKVVLDDFKFLGGGKGGGSDKVDRDGGGQSSGDDDGVPF